VSMLVVGRVRLATQVSLVINCSSYICEHKCLVTSVHDIPWISINSSGYIISLVTIIDTCPRHSMDFIIDSSEMLVVFDNDGQLCVTFHGLLP
jgi:hypothetical protein